VYQLEIKRAAKKYGRDISQINVIPPIFFQLNLKGNGNDDTSSEAHFKKFVRPGDVLIYY